MTLLKKPLSGLFSTLENGDFIDFSNDCFLKKRLFAGSPFIKNQTVEIEYHLQIGELSSRFFDGWIYFDKIHQQDFCKPLQHFHLGLQSNIPEFFLWHR